jgi:hypothetical protein
MPGEDPNMKYHVGIRQVHIQTLEVNAESEEDALAKVNDGEGEEIGVYHVEDFAPKTWTVKPA